MGNTKSSSRTVVFRSCSSRLTVSDTSRGITSIRSGHEIHEPNGAHTLGTKLIASRSMAGGIRRGPSGNGRRVV